MVGDSLFLAGTLAFAWFVAGLWRGWSYEPEAAQEREIAGAPLTTPLT